MVFMFRCTQRQKDNQGTKKNRKVNVKVAYTKKDLSSDLNEINKKMRALTVDTKKEINVVSDK